MQVQLQILPANDGRGISASPLGASVENLLQEDGFSLFLTEDGDEMIQE
jgi:hypothetical protein